MTQIKEVAEKYNSQLKQSLEEQAKYVEYPQTINQYLKFL